MNIMLVVLLLNVHNNAIERAIVKPVASMVECHRAEARVIDHFEHVHSKLITACKYVNDAEPGWAPTPGDFFEGDENSIGPPARNIGEQQ